METRTTPRPGQKGTRKLAVRIAYPEADFRERAKRLGAVWRPAQKLWELSWLDAKRLGIADRVVTTPPNPEVSSSGHLPA